MSLSTDASPIGTFNYAHSFLGAAKALDRLEWEDRETHSDSPVEFLYWHSIELFLKAFLLAHGMELRKLRSRVYGHNISALSAEAKKRGLRLSAKDEEPLSYMPSTKYMIDLRYLKVGVRAVPDFEEIEETCENLYRDVGLEIQKKGISQTEPKARAFQKRSRTPVVPSYRGGPEPVPALPGDFACQAG